jgi:4-hydroxy-L-threonine phosphate dehydrogenase PdxA
MQARRGEFDVVVVRYHDQGHIPVKLMDFNTIIAELEIEPHEAS